MSENSNESRRAQRSAKANAKWQEEVRKYGPEGAKYRSMAVLLGWVAGIFVIATLAASATAYKAVQQRDAAAAEATRLGDKLIVAETAVAALEKRVAAGDELADMAMDDVLIRASLTDPITNVNELRDYLVGYGRVLFDRYVPKDKQPAFIHALTADPKDPRRYTVLMPETVTGEFMQRFEVRIVDRVVIEEANDPSDVLFGRHPKRGGKAQPTVPPK